MNTRRGKCPDCAGGFLTGNGKCGQCNGTGVNTQVSSAQPKCPYCHGTGICATCGGDGYPADRDDEIQTLFGDK